MTTTRTTCAPEIIPALLSSDLAGLSERAALCGTLSPWMQVDIVDGIFASPASWPFAKETEEGEVSSVLQHLPQNVRYEVHVMANDPEVLVGNLLRAGFSRVIVHIESFTDTDAVRHVLRMIRENGAEAGVTLNVDTPLSSIDTLVSECDVVQVMSIASIGKHGRPFDERALSRIEELRATYPSLNIAVDGGITEANVEEIVRAGADRIVAGSSLFEHDDIARTYACLLSRAQAGCAPRVTLSGA